MSGGEDAWRPSLGHLDKQIWLGEGSLMPLRTLKVKSSIFWVVLQSKPEARQAISVVERCEHHLLIIRIFCMPSHGFTCLRGTPINSRAAVLESFQVLFRGRLPETSLLNVQALLSAKNSENRSPLSQRRCCLKSNQSWQKAFSVMDAAWATDSKNRCRSTKKAEHLSYYIFISTSSPRTSGQCTSFFPSLI